MVLYWKRLSCSKTLGQIPQPTLLFKGIKAWPLFQYKAQQNSIACESERRRIERLLYEMGPALREYRLEDPAETGPTLKLSRQKKPIKILVALPGAGAPRLLRRGWSRCARGTPALLFGDFLSLGFKVSVRHNRTVSKPSITGNPK